MTPKFPSSARAVVIGGGVIGCSVAYHLTKHGWRDVVLLEQGRLTCGTTWHAAGLVGQLRAHQNMTRLVQYSAALYQRLEVETGQATGWATSRGDIAAEVVINCAGQWAKQVGRLCGVTVPLHSAEHMYVVTGRIDGVHTDLPVLRDPDGYIYVKEEVGGLLVGGFEPVAKPWGMDGIPENFEFGMLPDDWDQFEILMENALIRIPGLQQAEIKTFMNGPESFTPDNNFILGPAPELKNFYVAAGFNSIGIASAGGAGRALAEWIVAGEPSLDLWPVDIRRFAPFHNDDRFLRE